MQPLAAQHDTSLRVSRLDTRATDQRPLSHSTLSDRPTAMQTFRVGHDTLARSTRAVSTLGICRIDHRTPFHRSRSPLPPTATHIRGDVHATSLRALPPG